VPKAMELLPLGPVMLIDTPGLDDVGELGSLRVQKTYQILNKTDIALLVFDGSVGMTEEDQAILERIKAKKIPYILVRNKADLPQAEDTKRLTEENIISVSAAENTGIYELKELLAKQMPANENTRRIVADLLEPQDFVVLVIPIDSAAPKGRLILPQQQTIRDCLEAGAIPVMCRETELVQTLETLGKPPKLVITDSQIFGRVSKDIPKDLPLTSFSILFARYKGDLESTVTGARALEQLRDGDTVLISEGCTHHRQCEDIGTVKLPRWILQHTGKDIQFAFTSGREFPDDLSPYALVVHCGGCTLNEREMRYRLSCAADQNIPMTNYGICIAYINGILERSIQPLGI
ncbi:MAG: [Anaerotignum sp.]|nr:[FeFe] hydrogenase H-cluster maturation GTPase HydF [Anaerotignum sp.]